MTAMCDDITRQHKASPVDFLLLTGDLAYSGDPEEYSLLPSFLNNLVTASGITRERVFTIPGNHDIARERQQFCFRGARSRLTNPSAVDEFLGNPESENFKTLLAREHHYRHFQETYFAGQNRLPTADGLGYVAHLTIGGVRLSIMALDSSWLANGGPGDHGRLLIGERQVLHAIDLIEQHENPPQIVVAMSHHPPHLLIDFDRHATQSRIEDYCHFFHCGHLHKPEQRTAGLDPSGCVSLTAGASYEGREAQSSYTVVTLDLLSGKRTINTHSYNAGNQVFRCHSSEYPIEVRPFAECGIEELAREIHAQTATPWPHYLAALLLDHKTDIVIVYASERTTASVGFLERLPADTALRNETMAFFQLRYALRVHYGRRDLGTIVHDHKEAVIAYSEALLGYCSADPSLETRLRRLEEDSLRLSSAQPGGSFVHTANILLDLAADGEWEIFNGTMPSAT